MMGVTTAVMMLVVVVVRSCGRGGGGVIIHRGMGGGVGVVGGPGDGSTRLHGRGGCKGCTSGGGILLWTRPLGHVTVVIDIKGCPRRRIPHHFPIGG